MFDTFAKQRGFEPAWLEEFGLCEAEDGEVNWSGGKWIRIPYTNKTGTWYNRWRVIPGTGHTKPKYLSPDKVESRLYNPLHLGPNVDYVWFCEGEFDALALINLGLNAVAVGGANAWKNHWSLLFSSATVIIAYDNDEAGQKNAIKTEGSFKNAFVFDRYPDDIVDLNEWMMEDKDGMMTELYAYMDAIGVR